MDVVISPYGFEDIVYPEVAPPLLDSSINGFSGTSVESSLIGQISQSNFECSNILTQYNNISYTLNQYYQGYLVMDPNVVAESEQHLIFYNNQLTNQIKLSEQIFDQISRQLEKDLDNWLIIQKQVSCGPRATVKSHYDLLDAMDKDFEDCGAQLAFLIDVVNHFCALDVSLIKETKKSLEQKAVTFVGNSLIVATQPPAIIVKKELPPVGDSTESTPRGTKFPCKTELRLLGGSALGVRNGINHAEVDIVSVEVAKYIKENSCRPIIDPKKEFNLVNRESTFKTDEASGVYSACFENRMVGVPKKRGQSGEKKTRRPNVASLRYYFAYKVHLTGLPYISVESYKLSLPVAALVHLDLKTEYTMFWDRCFSKGTGILNLTDVRESVPWTEMKNALNLKFMALVQEAQDAKDLGVDLPAPRGLSNQSLEHLGSRLKMERNLVHRKHFFLSEIASENNNPWSQQYVFYEWFHKCGNMVNKYMQKQWNDGLIAGFCSKEKSERSLAPCRGTMMIRFSNMFYGRIKLTCQPPSGELRHYEVDIKQLCKEEKNTIGDHVKNNSLYNGILRIYPRHHLSTLWDTKEDNREPTTRETATGNIPQGYSNNTIKLVIKLVAEL